MSHKLPKGAPCLTAFGSPGNKHKSPRDYTRRCIEYHGSAQAYENWRFEQEKRRLLKQQ